jgi:hypothetical protein
MELNDSTCFLVLQRIFGMLLNKPIQRQKMLLKSMMWRLKHLLQSKETITEYANQLKFKDSAVLKEFIEQHKVYDFLLGLNPKFDQVRIQISIHSNELQ